MTTITYIKNLRTSSPQILPQARLWLNKTAARLTGISLILMALISFFAYGYAHSSLIVTGDAEATLANLSTSKGLFTGEIIGWGFYGSPI